MSTHSNLNKFKNLRRRKNASASFSERTDMYGFVKELSGDKHLVFIPVIGDIIAKYSLCARIPGKFFKRVWFRKDDLIVVTKLAENLYEIKGKVAENEIDAIKNKFIMSDEKIKDSVVIEFSYANNKNNDVVEFTQNNSESDNESDIENTNNKTNDDINTNDDVINNKLSTNVDNNSDNDIDIDAI